MWTRRLAALQAGLALVLGGCRHDGSSRAHPSPTAPAAASRTPGTLPEGVVLPRYSEVVAETGRNLAYDQPAATVDPLGFQQMNINWRNFYLSAALELEGHLDRSRYSPKRGTAILERLPLVNLLEKMLTRIDAEQTQDVHMTVAFHLADSGQDYALEIRRGIVQLHRQQPPHADVTLSGNEDDLRRMLLRQTSFLKEWALGRIHVDGSTSDMARFFGYFDPPAETPPNLVVR